MSIGLAIGLHLGRGGKPFDPRSLGNLVLWLDATRISGLADAAAVAQWDDLSGLGNHAAQATSGKRPTFQSAGINSRPAVVFDATDDFLLTPTVALGGATGVTVFAVFTASGAATRVVCEASAAPASQTDAFQMYRATANNARARCVGNVGTSEFASTSTSVGNSAANAVTFSLDKTLASGSEAAVTVDGVATGAATSSANNTNGFGDHAWYIGASVAGTTSFLSGRIAELAGWNRKLTAGEIAQLATYARNKWGTP